jgi:hypothetical protein
MNKDKREGKKGTQVSMLQFFELLKKNYTNIDSYILALGSMVFHSFCLWIDINEIRSKRSLVENIAIHQYLLKYDFKYCNISQYEISKQYPALALTILHLPNWPLNFLPGCRSSMVDPPRLDPAMLSLSMSVYPEAPPIGNIPWPKQTSHYIQGKLSQCWMANHFTNMKLLPSCMYRVYNPPAVLKS